MAVLKLYKEVSSLPTTLEADAAYFVRVGTGFDLYVTDGTGSVAYKNNGLSVIDNLDTQSPTDALSANQGYVLRRTKVNYIESTINPTQQGTYVSWNRDLGLGRTYYINRAGLGAGGFTFINETTDTSTRIATIEPDGIFTCIGEVNIRGVGNNGIRVGSKSGATSTPFLDFNSSGGTNDRDTRIIASGGSATANEQGILTYRASQHSFIGNIVGSLQGNATTATTLAIPTGRRIIIGSGASTTGNDSIVIGTSATTNAYSNSVSIGLQATVSANNQIQLGNSLTTTYVYGAVQDRSDKRDKADIQDTDLGLSFIKALRPVKYKWDYREDYILEKFPPVDKDMFFDEESYSRDCLKAEYFTENPEDGASKPYPKKEEYFLEVEYEKACEDRTKAIANFYVNPDKDGTKIRDRYHYGLVADEMKEVLDDIGIDFGGYQEHSKTGGLDVKSIGYSELISPMIKAIQELSLKVEGLEKELKGV